MPLELSKRLQFGLRSRLLKLEPGKLAESWQAATRDDTIVVDWVDRGPVRENWGDAVAPIIANALSGKRVVNRRHLLSTAINRSSSPSHTTIGSMLGTVDYDNAVVWGSGFVDSGANLRVKRMDVRMVRGPLTRQKLLDGSIPCPELYGDPALLFSLLYPQPKKPRFSLGVIPHFKEYDHPTVQALRSRDDVRVIDIRGGIKAVANEVLQCEHVASASLHGLVLADSYLIPTIWVRFSERPAGDGFKFRDYLASVERQEHPGLDVDAKTTVAEILDQFSGPMPSFDTEEILNACPFYDGTIRTLQN